MNFVGKKKEIWPCLLFVPVTFLGTSSFQNQSNCPLLVPPPCQRPRTRPGKARTRRFRRCPGMPPRRTNRTKASNSRKSTARLPAGCSSELTRNVVPSQMTGNVVHRLAFAEGSGFEPLTRPSDDPQKRETAFSFAAPAGNQ